MVLESVAPDAAVSGAWPAGVGGFKNMGKKYGEDVGMMEYAGKTAACFTL